MTPETLLNELWLGALARLGGPAVIEACARQTGAFLRPRAVKSACDLLRLVLAYCLGGMGLRSTSAWAASVQLADLSNVALLKRLRNCEAWLEHLVGQLLGGEPAAHGRRILLIDGTMVPKASRTAKQNNGLWRIEMAFKRLKSILGLEGPPGEDPKIAKTWILAHLLMVLLLEPHISAPEISPRLAA